MLDLHNTPHTSPERDVYGVPFVRKLAALKRHRIVFRFKFHWNMFTAVQFAIRQHWDNDMVPSMHQAIIWTNDGRSISWLLMPWLLTSPGHQQPWYWLYIVHSTSMRHICVIRSKWIIWKNSHVSVTSTLNLWLLGVFWRKWACHNGVALYHDALCVISGKTNNSSWESTPDNKVHGA